MATTTRGAFLTSLYHHVVLPRQTPGKEDSNLNKVDAALLDHLLDAVKALVPLVPLPHQQALDAVRLALSTCKVLNVEGKVDKTLLSRELGRLGRKDALILYINEQNAGLLIYRRITEGGEDDAVFEVFEAAAKCSDVLESRSALRWDFPGQAVSIPYNRYCNISFQEALSTFVEQASMESIKDFSAVTYKAKAPLPEIRDSTNPDIMSGLLMTILEGNGTPYFPPILRKRVRDTVCWDKSEKPWRRSPFYLVLRVAIQRHLYHMLGGDIGRMYYKSLMCISLSKLLSSSLYHLTSEATYILAQKLGSRLAKLEVDRQNIANTAKTAFGDVFSQLRGDFTKTLSWVQTVLTNQWGIEKKKGQRYIHRLRRYAGAESLSLKLPLSGFKLDEILWLRLTNPLTISGSPLDHIRTYDTTVFAKKPFAAVARPHIQLLEYEETAISLLDLGSGVADDCAAHCIAMAAQLEAYVEKTGTAFDEYPELKSTMLLNMLELWIAMDANAVACYKLLGYYHPGFESTIVDDLHLMSFGDMQRAHRVQLYLSKRCRAWAGSGSRTIFDEPANDSFAVRYYDESVDSYRLKDLRRKIEEKAKKNRDAKEAEWEEMSSHHENLMQQISESSCVYVTYAAPDGVLLEEHVKPCHKHTLKWQAKQMKIKVFEYPLPNFEPAAKAAVFELACPKAFVAYRDATWLVLSTFAFAKQDPLEDVPLLRNYSGLRRHATTLDMKVSLGSSTKSHLDCHYAISTFPVTLRQIIRPCGLKLSYYDCRSRTWTSRDDRPSLSVHFPIKIPRRSPFAGLHSSHDTWPSSNKILASQTKCPGDLNVHEFMAWQGVLNGTHVRWLSLLRELGSTNLNFSTDSTWGIVFRLVLQIGPASTEDPSRDIHAALKDPTFCQKLFEQIKLRIEAIRRNWREPVQMDTLISILLKAKHVCTAFHIRSDAMELLRKIRAISWDWHCKIQSSSEELSQAGSSFAIWAPVLCKRTFQMYPRLGPELDSGDLQYFIAASVALQDNLMGNFNVLPFNLRNVVLQDLTFTHANRDHLRSALLAQQNAVVDALTHIWSPPYHWTPSVNVDSLAAPWWIILEFNSARGEGRHYVQYNYVYGSFLVNGEPHGFLPSEYRQVPVIQELFGTQNLRVLPSYMPGMALYVARVMPYGHRIHLGLRNGHVVVRARQETSNPRGHNVHILELIDSNVFQSFEMYDLPSPLIDNCRHWLNLETGILEIRQENFWKSKPGDWKIHVPKRSAMRRKSRLVDPNSQLALQVAQNFYYFEYPRQLVIFQPKTKPLSVELKRLELAFKVNGNNLLESHQLGAEIAETEAQDCGTWYGLRSKIVLRSIRNERQRSVIVPMGDSRFHADGSHVAIYISNPGLYARFGINDVLGRVECPAEPTLLYLRAMLHAYTSHFLPDPLTGRTGTEEAIYYLKLSSSLPWEPLKNQAVNILEMIDRLSPRRGYYPQNLKSMETVVWQHELSTMAQDDRYRSLVNFIRQRSLSLALFAAASGAQPARDSYPGELHLEYRASYRLPGCKSGEHLIYQSRDRRKNTDGRENVAIVTKVLLNWPSMAANTPDLAALLQEFPVIGGYIRQFGRVQITDLLTIDLGLEWGALASTAMSSGTADKYRLLFLFATMAFSSDANMDLIQVLVCFAMFSDLKNLEPPSCPSYTRFGKAIAPTIEDLASRMKAAKIPFVPVTNGNNLPRGQLALSRIQHEKIAEQSCMSLAEFVLSHWPQEELKFEAPPTISRDHLDIEEALTLIQPEWERLAQNFKFSNYLEKVQLVLNRHSPAFHGSLVSEGAGCGAVTRPPQIVARPQFYSLRIRGGELPQISDLMQKNVNLPEVLAANPRGMASLKTTNGSPNSPPPRHIKDLITIVDHIKNSCSVVHRKYGMELGQSIKALLDQMSRPSIEPQPFNPNDLKNQIYGAAQVFKNCLDCIEHILQADDDRATWLQCVGLWPKVTPVSLLTELRSTSGAVFGEGTREALVGLALSVTSYQRLLRIEDATLKGRHQQSLDERTNFGHQNWSPLERVDWLLLEIESDILIRPEQVEVALATIAPQSGENSVVQLLMGKGKTSCILPMVATVLADGRHLARIVVPRALLLQSAQVLQTKLGGLLNREVMHISFSRKTSTSQENIRTYTQLHGYLKKCKGIMLALPECLLSFKLSGLQRLVDRRVEEATLMIKAQAWLEKYARDVLDECDVSLAIRTQLIYPSGTQMSVDGHPLRWQTVQAVLRLIRSHLPHLVENFPRSIEVVERDGGGYPLVYFLRKDVEDYLVSSILEAICKGQTTVITCAEYPDSHRADIKHFISSPTVGADVVRRINLIFHGKLHLMKVMYLLRGLFVHRIMLSAMKKRWNVQYGLHPTRCPIAVPFLAKGVPSPTAEWGHPDVAIILTCLSFYYQGLDLVQFKQAFQQLLKSDEPSIEFEKWASVNLPHALRYYNAINVEDSSQLRELHSHIRYNPYLLDFFMNSFVFPKHAKQFETKLQASGWDLVLFNPTGDSNCRTTGFSGTNDTRHQLPMTIKQHDLPNLSHTNAEVLSYLLESRNRRYILAVDSERCRLSEEGLLLRLLNPLGKIFNVSARGGDHQEKIVDHSERIRVLIDAGAQILEHDNLSFARAWLKTDTDAAAAVFFNADHQAWVLYRKGVSVPLLASPFAEDLEGCLVYLDESHCRGTDLKLPPQAKAALTLGPHLTKDALVQAAMRLRLLGQTQSVTFFSPLEVHQSILDLRGKRDDYEPDSSDVLHWLLEQTCNGIEQLEPLYFNQGISYLQRIEAGLRHPNFLTQGHQRTDYLSIMRSKELQSLKQLYEPKLLQSGAQCKSANFAPALHGYVSDLLVRRKNFQDRGIAVHSSALEEVEQEREVEFEVESVRETQPPVHFTAHKFPRLHKDIEAFAVTGRLPAGSDAFQPVFCALQQTGLGRKHGANLTASSVASGLFVSTQFCKTVKLTEPNDNFLRPCQWILWSCSSASALIVSPEEANLLIPVLRMNPETAKGYTHLIVYAAPATRRMLHFNSLDYYATPPLPDNFIIPTWVKIQLGIFAGRLYFEWDEYFEMLGYLGVKTGTASDEEFQIVDHQAFAKKPLTFLHDWLAVRRKGQDFEHTPMGFVTTGKPLSKEHPFFLSSAVDGDTGPVEPAKTRNKNGLIGSDDTGSEAEDEEDEDEDDDFYDAEEQRLSAGDEGGENINEDEEENIPFFDGAEYVEETANSAKDNPEA
ncbi:hypothetical protein BCR34DRAFT_608383 [Clohesyomyces aquaticus]|uniref:ubiquitinyl hydrolase 1 n=1 Tax=Clohesyomyces aquaticus TaxID=1231657 RepID=A0A1Y1Y7T3_9PLEO|nr:hypothetical protein BCR34DRAFT_608383 [Clohesyomyces aquaticus]